MFSATTEPQLVVKNKQQTPNPSAQEPSPQQVSSDYIGNCWNIFLVTISTLHVTVRICQTLSEPGSMAAWEVKIFVYKS